VFAKRTALLILLMMSGAARGWDTNDWQFLESIERVNLRFFEEQKRGPYKLLNDTAAYDSTFNYPAYASVAGTGFELTAICLGHYRGWITFSNAYEQVLLQLKLFNGMLSTNPFVGERVNGWTWHTYWIEDSGTNKAGTRFYMDDGLSLLDHSLFIAGCIFVSEYFKGTEAGLLAHKLYEETTWSWRPNGDYNFGYSENLLAVVECAEAPAFKKGGEAKTMWNSYVVPWPRELQLYFWQYPHAWIDFRFRTDERGFNHADVARDSILYQRQRAIELRNEDPVKYDMLGSNVWGWTAAGASDGYRQMAPWGILGSDDIEWCTDSGTITPFALPPCMIYAGSETMAAMKHVFEQYYINGWDPSVGERPVWSHVHGWLNCLNKGRPWRYYSDPGVSNHFHGINAGIDYGPNVLLLENYKIGSTWRWFMQNPYVSAGMYTLGFGPPSSIHHATFSNSVNEFGGSIGHWENDATPVTATYEDADWTNAYVGDKVVRFVADNSNEGGWIDLGDRDQRAKAQVTFWIRGGTGLERMDVGLKDQFNLENKVVLLDYTGGVMPTNWTEVKIPIEAFCLTGNVTNDVWPGSLRLLSFAFTNPEGGTLDVDYVAFTRDTISPARPTNHFGCAMVGNRPRVRWASSATEPDVVGYHVWRRHDGTSGFVRATSALVPRHVETWEDTNVFVEAGSEIRYAIQALDNAEPANSSPFAFEIIVTGGKFDLDWNNGANPNAFGGLYDGHWGANTGRWFGFVYTNGPGGAQQWVRRSWVSTPGSGHFIDTADGDAADYSALRFFIRGAVGGEQVMAGLKDDSDTEVMFNVGEFIAGGTIGTEWSEVIIPLSEFAGVNVSALSIISWTHATGGEVFIADIGFLQGQRFLFSTNTAYRECEDYDAQYGSAGEDVKEGASAGRVLGQSWGVSSNSVAVYSNVVVEAHTNAWFHLWYAMNAAQYEGRVLELHVDGVLRAYLTCPATGGWGERVAHFDRVAVRAGPIEAGSHTVALIAREGALPINLDCFYIGAAAPDSRGMDRDGDGLSDREEAIWMTTATEPDSDGDGIPDGDELQFGSLGQVSDPSREDSDFDGLSDYEEWICGTDPLSADSLFLIQSLRQEAGGDVTVEWPAVSGRLYRVFYSEMLSNGAVFLEVPDPGNVEIEDNVGRYRPEKWTNMLFYLLDVRRDQ
jgi:hypothetical protein